MSYNLIFTKEGLTDVKSGDISNFIENKSNKIWYVIDAVSTCDNPRLAAFYAHEIIQEYVRNNIIETRFDIGGLIIGIHNHLQAQELKLSACFSAVIELPNKKKEAINVGDCRVYELRENFLIRVTKDDSIVQELIDKGELTAEKAHVHSQKSFVTQALGGTEVLKMNFYDLDENTTGFMLTSDGVHGELMDQQMEHVLFKENLSIHEAYSSILERSKALEGDQDDQSLMIVRKDL